MSRSYHKQPVWKDHNKGMKQIANRKVRRALKQDLDLHLPRSLYKRYSCSYDICDYCWLVPKDFESYYQREFEIWTNLHFSRYCKEEEFPSREDLYKEWIKYKRK